MLPKQQSQFEKQSRLVQLQKNKNKLSLFLVKFAFGLYLCPKVIKEIIIGWIFLHKDCNTSKTLCNLEKYCTETNKVKMYAKLQKIQ